jgi:hypothetical protein
LLRATRSVEEHLEISPIMWITFIVILGVYIALKEISYETRKSSGEFFYVPLHFTRVMLTV